MMHGRIRQSVPLAALGLIVFVAAGCGGSPAGMSDGRGSMKGPMKHVDGSALADTAATDGSPMAGSPKTAKGAAPDTAAANQIIIDNFTFTPPTLCIASGTEVTWVNHDDVPHTVTHSVKPRLFDSGTMDTDARFARRFTTPGTYDYYCAVHPRMTGKIIVK
jgi:plastocyanin